MLDNNWKLISSIVGVSSITLAVVSFWARTIKKRALEASKIQKPEKWIKIGTISELIIYPLKSGKGINVSEAIATEVGLKGIGSKFFRDRIFIIVDGKGNCQTLRNIPKLAKLDIEVKDDKLILSMPDVPSFFLQIPDENSPSSMEKYCRIFEEKYKAIDCGDEVSKWLESNFDKTGLRLYFHGQNFQRQTSKFVTKLEKKFQGFSIQDKGTFQDETSYMLMSEESVNELNSKLKNPVTHRNFRPSFLIKGVVEPFLEDFCGFVKIGNDPDTQVTFKGCMPCQRCRLTTVTPEGKFDEDGEPLKTLKMLKRRVGNEKTSEIVKNDGIMGLHMGLFNIEEENRKINVGDSVYAALL